VGAVNSLVAFYDVYGRKGEVLRTLVLVVKSFAPNEPVCDNVRSSNVLLYVRKVCAPEL
jgi:hypothetical protein